MALPEIYSQLTEVFRDLFDDDSISLTPETTADDIPGYNSLMHVNVILAVESRFNIKFRTSEVEALHNIGNLGELIELKLNRQSHVA
jgi:acyl carrier protein